MSLQSILLCSDEKIVRVLRRVLSDLEIGVEHCADTDAALRKLTRQRFEAVIVDCADEEAAGQILKSIRSAPGNRRALAVAMIDSQQAVRTAFSLGAHFVLYKPISSERARIGFRAVRALMKRERRRNTRIPIELAVTLVLNHGEGHLRTTTVDLGEGGMAIELTRRPPGAAPLRVELKLPGSETIFECAGEVAWEDTDAHTGIRFVDLSAERSEQLKAWMASHSPDLQEDDPPIECKLTDLSLGGCYVEMASPFPARSTITLSMQTAKMRAQVQGVVRVMHPEVGMGVELTRATAQAREQVKEFIHHLVNSKEVPELLVQPKGMEEPEPPAAERVDELDDPLLNLFRSKCELATQDFLIELRSQRRSASSASLQENSVA